MEQKRWKGFTLLELLIVITILGIVALVAIPYLQSPDTRKLEVAANEAVMALRYAKSQAIRTGKPHGTRFTAASDRITVFELDTTSPPIDSADEITLRHPQDKKLYDLDINSDTATAGIGISIADFRFGGNPTPYESIVFNAKGTPIHIAADGTTTLMDQGEVRLNQDGNIAIVRVDAVTGRVTRP
jgi:prepilin-type N-terminal cleavage/methylation domain-containing protein